jgi:hypothetical protein
VIKLILAELLFLLFLKVLLPLLIISDFPGPYLATSAPNSFTSITTANVLKFPLYNPINLPLNSLSLTFKNPLIQNQSEVRLDLILPDNSIYHSFSFNGANIGDPSAVTLNFLPTTKPLIAQLSTANQKPETLFVLTSNNSPQYSTTFHPQNLYSRLNFLLKDLVFKFSSIPFIYLITYSLFILLLDYVISKKS